MIDGISFTKDFKRAQRFLDSTQRKGVARATSRTLNKTATTVRAKARPEMKNLLGLRNQKAFRNALNIYRSNPRTLAATIIATGHSMPLIHFKHRPGSKGWKATVYGTERMYRGSFMASMPSGHEGLYIRKGGPRLPIKEMMGPGVPRAMADKAIRSAMKKTAQVRFNGIFRQEVWREIQRAKR